MAFEYMLAAAVSVFQPLNLIVLVLAVFSGLIMGILPGLSATMAIALLTGLTYGFPKAAALISLIGIYVGSISGGCQSAILLNIPGTPASAATAMDGFPMAKRGEAGHAIFLATTVSMIGTLFSVICVLTLTPVLTGFALKFTSWEFFLLAVFGIMICGSLTSNGNALKGWISGILGLTVAMVGMDTVNAYPRFSYGNVNLMAGIQLIPVMIGLFGFPEIVQAFTQKDANILQMTTFKVKEGFRKIARNWIAVVRSSLIGVGVGIIPGVGEDVGGWLSYWASRSSSKNPDSFGKGNELGVISAETGNNACIGGAIIPVMSLAVPGSAPAAVLLAAFLMHGYRPGPLLMSESPEFVYQISIYLVFAAVAMWLLSLVIARFSVRILGINKKILMPIIYVLCVIGAFLINHNSFDVKMMFIFGLVGLLLRAVDIPSPPFLLGVILGPMADSNLRRALIISDGSLMPMFGRPICIVFLVVIASMILSQMGVFRLFKKSGKRA
jgi:putative tricarboxylic transport membrane protein